MAKLPIWSIVQSFAENKVKDKFKNFKEMIRTRDVNKEKFNELIKNSLHGEYMYVRETALVVGDEMIDHVTCNCIFWGNECVG